MCDNDDEGSASCAYGPRPECETELTPDSLERSRASTHRESRTDRFVVVSVNLGLVESSNPETGHCWQFLTVDYELADSCHESNRRCCPDRSEMFPEGAGIITSRDGNYKVSTTDLDTYLIPKKPQHTTIDLLHKTGRGIGYTSHRSPTCSR